MRAGEGKFQGFSAKGAVWCWLGRVEGCGGKMSGGDGCRLKVVCVLRCEYWRQEGGEWKRGGGRKF